LFIGNVHAADPERHERQFDHVLSVTGDEQPLTTHHHPLSDGADNDWRTFEAVADAAHLLYRRDGSTLVHCEAGISRSATLVALALAAEEDWTFVDALHEVQNARLHAVPHPALHELGVVYLAARA
jgi:atypical dual specificity phosphatase